MMLGERSYGGGTAHAPPWSSAANDPPTYVTSPTAVDDYSIFFQTDSLNSLQRFLPSNSNDVAPELHFSDSDNGEFFPADAHSCDHFRMYEFKVRKCTRGRSHDWTECPFAHPGEKARRRDPRKYHYSGAACPEFRKGSCRKGDACEFSHGVFECWLHPARYRTQPCKDGMNCKRRVCFFAHLPDQLRLPSPRGESISPPIETPPMMAGSVHEMAAALRRLQLDKVKSMPPSWRGGCSSPRLKVGYLSMPTTPTGTMGGTGLGLFDAGESEERVESGRDLREKMFEKLSKENPLDTNLNPDVEWVSDLVN